MFSDAPKVKDKDGIAAASVFVEMAKTWSLEGRSCKQQLQELYEKYGALQSLNSYVKSPDPSITAGIFAAQRGSDKSSYPKAVGDFKVTAVRDLTIGYDSRTSDGKPELPLNLGGEMITYYFGEALRMFSFNRGCMCKKAPCYNVLRLILLLCQSIPDV